MMAHLVEKVLQEEGFGLHEKQSLVGSAGAKIERVLLINGRYLEQGRVELA